MKNVIDELSPLLSLEESALVALVPLATILRGIGDFTLPYHKVNGRYRIQVNDLWHFKEAHDRTTD